MENKLGNYFTKGLQAGVLATALIAGNVSCSQPSGGSEIDGPTPPDEPTVTSWGYNDNNFSGFNGFVEYGKHYYDSTADFTTDYNAATTNMGNELTELNKLIAEQSGKYNYNYDAITKQLSTYNTGNNISERIENNYKAVGPVINQLLTKVNDDVYNKYYVYYYALAHEAYKKSLSNNSQSLDFQVNQEMHKDSGTFFAQKLHLAKCDYDTVTQNSGTGMMDRLTEIAQATKIDETVLKKIIELALYNESLYGLNDLAYGEVSISGLKATQHSINDIKDYTNTQSKTINMDDRTM